MSIGDEVGLSEDLYQALIGRYVAAIEVLTRRSILKDQHIAKLETEAARHVEEQASEPKEGEVVYMTDEEFKATGPKRKK